MEPSHPSRVIHSSASAFVRSGIGIVAPMRYGVPKKITPAARRLRGLPMRR